MCQMQTWCVNPPVVLSVEISRREVIKYKGHNLSDWEESCQTVRDVCVCVRVCARTCLRGCVKMRMHIMHSVLYCTYCICMLYSSVVPMPVVLQNINSFLCPSFPLSFLSYRRSRRPVTPSSVLGVVMWLWMVWSPTLLTCFRSELALPLDTEQVAPASSSRPALTVSLAQSRGFAVIPLPL